MENMKRLFALLLTLVMVLGMLPVAYATATGLSKPAVKAAVDSASGGSILTWEAIEGADAYEIYRATSSKGKYTLVDTVTEAEAIAAVAVGKTYYFKVKAICEADAELSSEFSAVVKATGKCAQPEITVEANASGKPVVKWSKVSGAKNYTVYRATSENGKYTSLKTVTSTSYTDTSAKQGNTYYYKVKALASKSTYNGADSAIQSFTVACAQPALTVKVNATTGKADLSWKAITGAVSYDIYRATAEDGEYEKLASQTAVTYADTTAAADTDYWYKVQTIAAKEEMNSALSAAKKIHTTLAKPVVTFAIDEATGKPMLTWEEVEGAVEYKVYRSSKSTSSYKAVATITELSYTDTSVAVAKGYYYKVLAVGENAKSAYSAYKKLTAKCAQPVVELDINDNSQPVLTWAKVSGASKYTVYRTDDSGKEVSLGTTTKTTYTDKKAAEGASYTYRVLANGSKSTYNSVHSAPVSCTIVNNTPVLNAKLLDLGGEALQQIAGVLGAYVENSGFYWFGQGDVGFVFAYGTDKGANYIQGPVNRILDNCPETLTVKQLSKAFPGGEEIYDEMEGTNCFVWQYKGCTLMIYPGGDGKYSATDLFYYNCDLLVEKGMPTVNTSVLDLGGKNLKKVTEVLGDYEETYGFYWFDQGKIGMLFVFGEDKGASYIQLPLNRILDDCPESMTGEQLQMCFSGSKIYRDEAEDADCFEWEYQGCLLMGTLNADGKFYATDTFYYSCEALASPGLMPGVWTGSDEYNKVSATVVGYTDQEMRCLFVCEQLNSPYRRSETGWVTLTSSDGVNYTASNVMDSWENVYTVTVTMKKDAADIKWETTQVGEYANYSFVDMTVR